MIGRMIRRALRVSLIGKLIGANIIIVLSAILVQALASGGHGNVEALVAVLVLAAATIVNILLVRIALRPVGELERLAELVAGGDFEVRGSPSVLADKELSRVGHTVNSLLDALAVERQRIQDLGAKVVRAQDAERATVSRELHDSIAQTLAAVRFQLAAASHEGDLSEVRNILAAANTLISAAVREIISVSYTLHSQVTADLGLEAALGSLARQVADGDGASVDVVVAPSVAAIPPEAAATLYRVAEEALRGLGVRPNDRTATVRVSAADGMVRLEVAREGAITGGPEFSDLSGVGLAALRNRVLLAGGRMEMDSSPQGGARVTAELKMLRAAS